jgi:hypothetical protein
MKNTNSIHLAPNIETKGRLFRAIGAVAIGAGAVLLWPKSLALGAGLAASSAFLAFEATRGWCALRACGVKTKF